MSLDYLKKSHYSFVNIDGMQIHYLDTGLDTGKGFPILFGHSYLWNHLMWTPQVAALDKLGYRCIVPDLPGHGSSAQLANSYETLEDLAKLHHKLMQALGISQYAVVGLSIGGMWGAYLAHNYPNEVKGLVIMDSFLGPEPEHTKAAYMNLISAVSQQGFTRDLVKKISPFFFKLAPDVEIVEAYESYLQNIDVSQISSLVAIGKMVFNRVDSLHILEELMRRNMPVDIVVGAEDRARPLSEAQIMASILHKSPVVITDAGHISSLEQPGQVNEFLQDFLESLLCSN